MKKFIITITLVISSLLIGSPVFADTTVTFSGSEGKMFAPNCHCKEDVRPYDLAPWCGEMNSCNGESNTQTANISSGNYHVIVNVGGLTDSQKYEEVILTINGNDYSIPDLGGNGSSTGTASYDLGNLNLSGNVNFKAKHKYATTFTGKWYSSEASRIGSGSALESVDINSIVLQGDTPPPPPPTPTNGSCGTRNTSYLESVTNWPASTAFCAAGSVSPSSPAFPAQGATTTWTCNGSNGGSNATCQATRAALIPTNAACGTRSASYAATATDWTANTTFCTTGASVPANPTFPSQGGVSSWTCSGINNGANATCQATRGTVVPEEKENDDCKGEIGNYVWMDSNGDGKQDDSEKGISGVRVKLTFDDTTYRTTTDHKGRYSFKRLCKNDYAVIVKDEDVSNYTQTYDPDKTRNNKTDVELKNNHDSDMGADFGYKGKRIAPATGSGNIAIYASILITLIAFISYKKIRNKRSA